MIRLVSYLKRFWWILLLLLLTTAAGLAFCLQPEPPVKALEEARKALHQSRVSRSHDFAGNLYQQAEMFYDSAMILWRKENKRFLLMRDYTAATVMANRSRLASVKASQKSVTRQDDMSRELDQQLQQLQDDYAYFDNTFKHIPLHGHLPKKALHGRLLLSQAQLAFERGDLQPAQKDASECSEIIDEVLGGAAKLLKEYFDDYPKWREQYNLLMRQNKSGGYAIVVDKFAYCCYLYQNGKVIKTYDAEFGKNWIGPKKYQGDKATPEGLYSITKKKSGKETIYHLALLLNYPNESDLQRFKESQKKGDLPRNAKIGGLIEIHGHGGQGANWTEGCVALSDKEMNSLFGKVKVGTPVLIIGSLKSYEDIFKRH